MVFVVEPGDTFLLDIPNNIDMHLFVVVTEVDERGRVLLCPFWSQTHKRMDTTVVLHKGDHEFVKQDTIVQYADSRIMPICDLERKEREGIIKRKLKVTPEILTTIQLGIKKSKRTREEVREFYEEVMLFSRM